MFCLLVPAFVFPSLANKWRKKQLQKQLDAKNRNKRNERASFFVENNNLSYGSINTNINSANVNVNINDEDIGNEEEPLLLVKRA